MKIHVTLLALPALLLAAAASGQAERGGGPGGGPGGPGGNATPIPEFAAKTDRLLRLFWIGVGKDGVVANGPRQLADTLATLLFR